MEPDVERILKRFEEELVKQQKAALNPIQRALLACFLHYELRVESIPTLKILATQIGRSPGHTRDSATELYRIVAATLGGSVRKNTCGRMVITWYNQTVQFSDRALFGREQELQTLLSAIVDEGRRVVCVAGPPQIGKSFLVKRLCQALRHTAGYDAPIWCQATEAPTLEALYRDVSNKLGDRYLASVPAADGLMRLLDTGQRVLVIEHTDVLHDADVLEGRFSLNAAGYERWLRSLLERYTLSSCVIVVCRVPPGCLRRHHDILLTYPLSGLDTRAAVQLLRQAGLMEPSTEALHQLAQFCGYSPGVLQAAAYKINHSSSRDLNAFTSNPWFIDHADDESWQEALQALTPREQILMGWILLHPGMQIREVSGQLTVNGQLAEELPAVMPFLQRRGFVESDYGIYRLATEWLRYVTARHVLETCAQALNSQDLQTLNRYPLLPPTVPFWQRQWHWRQILESIKTEWSKRNPAAWSTTYQRDAINAMLTAIRADEHWQYGHAVGNLLNIAVALNIPLSSLNTAGLTIRYGDLSTANPQGVDWTHCTFRDSVLPLPLYGDLAAALAPDGNTIAVGDAEGRLLCWRRQGETYWPYRFAQFRSEAGQPWPIRQVSFGNPDNLALVADQQVYYWWLGDDQAPRELTSLSSPATYLAACCEGELLVYIAVGMANGQILLWDDLLDETLELGHHHGPIQELVPSLAFDHHYLVSRGYGDRVLVWNIRDPQVSPEEIRFDEDIFISTTWRGTDLLHAVVHGVQARLRQAGGQNQELPFGPNIRQLRFSADGTHLAAVQPDAVDVRALSNLSVGSTLPLVNTVNDMMLSNDGRWLLTKQYEAPQVLQIWDVHRQRIVWQVTAKPARYPGTDAHSLPALQGCQGLSEVERAFWQSYGVRL